MTALHSRRRANAMPAVLRFVFAHWAKQRGRAWLIVLSICGATVTEVFVPVFAGRIVDALAAGNRAAVLPAFTAMAALGLAMVGLRHTAWMSVVSFTLRLMGDSPPMRSIGCSGSPQTGTRIPSPARPCARSPAGCGRSIC